MNAKKVYNVAIYLRLSRDDGKMESDSITSQRDMIMSFIEKHEDMRVFDIYTDM